MGGEVLSNGVALNIENLDGSVKKTIESDYVLVATGRRPYTDGLQLDKIGI